MSRTVLRMGTMSGLAAAIMATLMGFGAIAASATVAPARASATHKGTPISNQICTYRLTGPDVFDAGPYGLYPLIAGDEVSGNPQVKDGTEEWYMYSFRAGHYGNLRWEPLQLEYCNPT
jgi:hypothetical protein